MFVSLTITRQYAYLKIINNLAISCTVMELDKFEFYNPTGLQIDGVYVDHGRLECHRRRCDVQTQPYILILKSHCL